MEANDIKTDREFQEILSPLTQEERFNLENSLRTEGCRDALVVWKTGNILLDGHNRYSFCKKHKIDIRVEFIDLPDRKSAYNWIIDNQLGRRNVSPDMASYLRGIRFNREKQTKGGDRKSKPHNEALKTSERLAKHFKVSKATIERDGEYAEALGKIGTEAKSAVLSGQSKATHKDVIAASKIEDEDERKRAIKDITSGTKPTMFNAAKSNGEEIGSIISQLQTLRLNVINITRRAGISTKVIDTKIKDVLTDLREIKKALVTHPQAGDGESEDENG